MQKMIFGIGTGLVREGGILMLNEPIMINNQKERQKWRVNGESVQRLASYTFERERERETKTNNNKEKVKNNVKNKD